VTDRASPFRFDEVPSAAGLISRLAYRTAKARGVAADKLLNLSGLTANQIQNTHLRIPVREQLKFVNQVAIALRDEFLGFHLAQMPDLQQLGLYYYVLASSETMLDAFQRGSRYTSIVNEGVSQKCVDGSDLRLLLCYRGVSRHLDCHQIEFWMAGIVRICRQLTGLRIYPSNVRLSHVRDGRCAELVEFFGQDIEFGAPVDEIVFPRRIRDLRVVSADSYLNELLVKYCEEALSQRETRSGSFSSDVENAIAPLLPHGKARVEEIARRIGMSQRTVARRLSAEGVTFTRLLERLRFDLAKRYLTEGSLPISELAWLLGYQEAAAFSHAFKRWTGQTPREARARAQQKQTDPTDNGHAEEVDPQNTLPPGDPSKLRSRTDLGRD
jgi:AraC-like DNA-binding protein